MPLDTKFARFVRSGRRSEFTLRLHQRPARRGRPVFARKSEFPDIDVYVEAFRTDLAAVDQDNRLFLAAHLDDALGPDFRDKVEGVRRVGSPKNSQGVDVVDFTGGRVRARFEILPDGEPRLITLYPQGVSR